MDTGIKFYRFPCLVFVIELSTITAFYLHRLDEFVELESKASILANGTIRLLVNQPLISDVAG